MARGWTHEEDTFIKDLASRRTPNRKIIARFRDHFGDYRSKYAIIKRRADLYKSPNLTEPDVTSWRELPTKPSERLDVDMTDAGGTVTIMGSMSIKNPEELFIKSELDPEIWEMVDAAPVRKWDVPMKLEEGPVVVPCYYVSIKVRKKWDHTSLPKPVILNYKPPKKAKRKKDRPFQSVHYSDLHLPYHDERALKILYAILEDVDPDIVVDHGDTIDCEQISSFKKDPAKRIPLRDEIQMGAKHFATVTELTPNAERIWCEGNHEQRLKRLIWSLAEGRQAGELLTLPKVAAALSWPSLLGLDELGWEMVEYPQHKLLFDKLILTHGEKVRGQSGQSEKAELNHYSKSGLSGHTHRVGYYGKKTYDGQVGWWGLGCMCAIRTSYISFPNWQQGMCVIVWAPDRQNFAVERVRIFDGVAYFRGRRYEG